MFKAIMLPVTIVVMSAKMTLATIKWVLKYRVGKVMVGCSLATAAIQYGGVEMSLAGETLIILFVGMIGTTVIIVPRLYDWWTRRRQKHKRDEKRRKAERENRL